MSRETMEQARALIQARQYDEARALLVTVDHPKAVEWIEKIDALLAQADDPFEKPKRALVVEPAPITPSPVMVIRDKGDQGPGCLVGAIWFLIVGWWLSQLAIWAGYLLVLTVILMPFGVMLLNHVPYLATLRRFKRELSITQQQDGVINVTRGALAQRPWYARALYFLVIGFWFGLIVIEVAWLLTATLILAPLGLRVFGFVPTAISLRR